MKKFLLACGVIASLSAHAQSIDPYRAPFQKPLEFSVSTKLNVQKIKLKAEDGVWTFKDQDEAMFNCEVKIKVEGRDLALKNKKIGEHYYGSMSADCDHLGKKFVTNYNRVLFLGLRNCIQSETVFDNDYCSISVIAMRKEKDLSLENGDLIELSSKIKKYYVIKDVNAGNYVRDNDLIPEGLQVSTVDSYQVFQLSLGMRGKDFFIEKPNSYSGFLQGQNIYLTPTDDVLSNDSKMTEDIEVSYRKIMNQLALLPNGTDGVKAFEKALPSILIELSGALKKLLGIITPVEFFRAEMKVKELEKTVLTVANTYKPNLLNRDDFKREYGSMSDEYNRYSNYIESKVKFAPPKVVSPIGTPGPTPVVKITNVPNLAGQMGIEYFFEGRPLVKTENEFFDSFIDNTCVGKVVRKLEEWMGSGSRIGQLKDKMIREKKMKHAWLQINLDDTRNEIQVCHNVQVIFSLNFQDVNDNLQSVRLTDSKFRVNPEEKNLNPSSAKAEDLMAPINEPYLYNAVLNLAF